VSKLPPLGAKHRGIGVHQQGSWGMAVAGATRNADAGAHAELQRTDLHRRRDGGEQFPGQSAELLASQRLVHPARKLGTTDAADPIRAAYGAYKTSGREAQQLVANGMFVAAVDRMAAKPRPARVDGSSYSC